MPISNFAQALVKVALGELGQYAGVLETDPRLKDRIYKTYLAELKVADPQDSPGWNMSSDIASWAWSATFVSWCLLRAGAKVSEFDFSVRHWVYANRAVKNAEDGIGVFRGYPIQVYAPQAGDIIVANREGGKIGFADAKAGAQYQAHGAIVVDFIVKNGVRYAVTVGGNEGQSVGRSEIELLQNGHIKPRSTNPYICVVQTLKTDAPPPVAALGELKVLSQGLPAALRGHGTFVYDTAKTVADYGSIPTFVATLKRAGINHLWLRVHGVAPISATALALNRSLIAACQTAGVAVAGWGWCQGVSPKPDAAMALKALTDHGLNDYVADIEPGHNNSEWTIDEAQTFCAAVRKGLTGGFAISSFALIDWHEPQILAATAPYIDAFAPQVYWFDYPNTKMIKQFHRADGTAYRAQSPAEYADLCLDRWARLTHPVTKPLILTGQAYWGEGATEAESDARLAAFLRDWNGYGRIAGLNWWHFGGGGAMSHAMLETIVEADLANRPYA
jgi:hypothetical protein